MELTWSMAAEPDEASGANAESRLVARVRGGDADAFATLVRLHQHRVFRLVGRFFRRPEDVEDVAQEVFLIAWSRLDTYKERAPFEHWLTRVCLNHCYARLRRRPPEDTGLDREPPARPAADPLAGLEVERLLGHLAPADRFILLLLDGEGWSTEEIAERLGWTRVNVKVRAHRARQRLRRLLETP